MKKLAIAALIIYTIFAMPLHIQYRSSDE